MLVGVNIFLIHLGQKLLTCKQIITPSNNIAMDVLAKIIFHDVFPSFPMPMALKLAIAVLAQHNGKWSVK